MPEPDPFVTLTVTDASGVLLAALPNSDVQHRISAALAEIIVNMAVARWPDSGHGLTATRDQRLMLSAAIYRLLRREDPGSRLTGMRPHVTGSPRHCPGSALHGASFTGCSMPISK